ncbi:MAG: macrolide transporter permease [Clostridiaceae bacterium]|jgi:putative ABC transport system permease protein|nr:macrolide transporter permease [Clostridiaceae bacterium]
MNLIENFKMAIDSILSNKLRSFLTMLGIIIGISSVITIVSLGQGGQKSITGEFEKIGSSNVSIKINAEKANTSDYFTSEDIRQIKEKISSIKYATPQIQKRGNVSTENKSKTAVITGGSEDMLYCQNYEILYGRFFNNQEYVEGKPVAVIDETSAKSIFGYADVVGMSINIGSNISPKKAKIVGVYKMDFNMFGSSNDNVPSFPIIPSSFLQTLYPDDSAIDTIIITANSKEDTESAGNAAKNMLQNRHENRERDIYQAENVLKQLGQVNKVLGIFTAFIGAVAAISLIVGGIGVMNIMLVSVTERTREIGIRKAVGATTKNILLQFLTESIIISLIGGLMGMAFGIIGAYIIGSFAKITPVLSPEVVIGAILFSSAVGIFFGIYPAKKAASLDPIEALRYE